MRRRLDAEQLLAAGRDNRPVSAPYTKLLTANIGVDQATGLVMCSVQAAADAGVPRDRWVFPLAGAHGHDEWFMSERRQLAASPAIRAAANAVLEHAGMTIDEIAYIDLYSCFPSAVQIAAAELGLATDERPLSLTGGLTFAGGPGNNYSSHAIAVLVHRLREDPDAAGLSSALGWYVTKHAAILCSGRPPARRFRDVDLNGRVEHPPPRRASASYSGTATVEAYTVPYAYGGSPEAALLSALALDRTRALVRSTNPELVQEILREDPLCRQIVTSIGNLEKFD